MRVAILYNPRAGKGRGDVFRRTLAPVLEAAGHLVRAIDVTAVGGDASALLEWSQGVVIIGGDGTLHHALPALLRTPRPIYHAAMGTENLFAREWGHRPDVQQVCDALSRGRVRTIDVPTLTIARIGARVPFAIMASIGPDASIIHRLSGRRAGPIRHLSYLRPIVRELVSPRVPTVTVEVDGCRIVDARPGMVVIANLRQYALRLDPLPDAQGDDGLLDVVFLPGRSLPSIALSLAAWRLGGRTEAIGGRGRSIGVETESTMALQADGEAVGGAGKPKELPIRSIVTCAIIPGDGLQVFA